MSLFLPLSIDFCSRAELKSIICLNHTWRFRWFLLFESLATCIRSQKNSESRVCCAWDVGRCFGPGRNFPWRAILSPPVWLASVGMFLAMIRGFAYLKLCCCGRVRQKNRNSCCCRWKTTVDPTKACCTNWCEHVFLTKNHLGQSFISTLSALPGEWHGVARTTLIFETRFKG